MLDIRQNRESSLGQNIDSSVLNIVETIEKRVLCSCERILHSAGRGSLTDNQIEPVQFNLAQVSPQMAERIRYLSTIENMITLLEKIQRHGKRLVAKLGHIR